MSVGSEEWWASRGEWRLRIGNARVWTEVGQVEAVGKGVMAGVKVDSVAIEADTLG